MLDNVVAPLVTPTTEGTLGDLPTRNAAESGDRVAFSRKNGSSWEDVTWTEFRAQVRALAKGFIASGLKTGDRIALMSRTRYEWTLVDFAAWTAGLIVVPVYETSSAEQVEWICSDSGASALVVETTAHEATVADVRSSVDGLKNVWVMDSGDLDRLAQEGGSVTDEELDKATDGMDRTSIATIIYTSGTTGRPKGCKLTHGNFMDLVENTVEHLGEVVAAERASTLLFLPLAHVFARFIEVLAVGAKARMGHSADIKGILDDFATFQPTFILAVPRVFEKIFNSAEAKAHGDGKGKIFDAATATAIAWSEAQDAGKVPFGLKAKHALFDKLVYGKLRSAMGGKVEYAVSGGAPLGTRLGHYFRGIGVTVLEGYGLTETTAPVTVNTPKLIKIGTVGAPIPGGGVKIADDGEILTKGCQTFVGYHNNEEATKAALEGGWFHTGDIGELDDDGYLRNTGRKKEILVTAGGKNVAPAVLEDRLRAHPLISQCIVVGDQKPFIGALLTLDPEFWPTWAGTNGLGHVSFEQAKDNEKVQAELQKAVDDANKAVSKAESIRKFRVLSDDFTEENGYLTPSLKLKRNVVMRDFADEVEALYAK